MAQNTQNDYNALKRRNRRRLVGAVVMVLLAVVILWQVLSKAPPTRVESQNIVINDGSGTIDTVPMEDVSATPTLPPLEVVNAPVVPENSSDVTIGDLNSQGTVVVTEDDGPAPSTQTTNTEPKPPVVTTTVKPPKVDKPVVVAKPPKVEKPVKQPSQVNPQDILDGKVVIADASTSTAKQGKVVIQVAALSDATKAAELKGRISGLGVNATVSKVSTSKGDISRVRVGPFASREEAQKTLQKLKNAGIDGIVVSQ